MATTKGGVIKKEEKKGQSGIKTMQQLVMSMKSQIEKALPSVLTGERFSRMILTAMSTTPQLQQCTPKSFLGAMMQAAQLGLEPNTPIGQAYLIPFKNKGILECQFQIGYKGILDLAYRSGEVNDVQAHEVYENDVFEYELGLQPKLRHVPARKDRGSVIMYYAVFHTKNGGYGFEVMSTEDVREHAKKYSQSYNSTYSPWMNHFDEMSKKTVLKKCLKYAPLKTEFVRGIAADETIKTSIADNMTEIADETDYTEIEAEATPVIPQNVDTETGEILSLEGKQESAPGEALFQSDDKKVANPEHTETAQAEYPGKRPDESALEYDRRMRSRIK